MTISTADLYFNELGTPVAAAFDDVYFSNHNGLKETEYVFISNNQLQKRWLACRKSSFVIAETGFGTGLNFLVVLQHFAKFREQHPTHPLCHLFFISSEKFPITKPALTKALAHWPELHNFAQDLIAHYPPLTHGCHRLQFPLPRETRQQAVSPDKATRAQQQTQQQAVANVYLDLWLGDVNALFPSQAKVTPNIVDAWFLDGFAPSKNPDMWQDSLFSAMAKLSAENATFATFTAAGVVKRGLAKHGFTVEKCAGFGKKRDMLRGVYQPEMADSQAQIRQQRQTKEQQIVDAIFTPYAAIPSLARTPATSPLLTKTTATNTTSITRVAVVGSGLAALNVAWSFVQHRIPVTLYCDEAHLATGASGNRQGALYPQLTVDASRSSSLYAQAFSFAVQRYRLLLHHGATFAHDFCGVLQCAFNDKQIARQNKLLAANNWPADLVHGVSIEEANKIAGVTVNQSGLFFPNGAWFNPKQLTEALASAAIQTGLLNIQYHKCLTHLEYLTELKQWRLHWQDQQCTEVNTVVLAMGHKSQQLAQLQHLPLQSVRGQVESVSASAKSAPLQTVLCHKGYVTPTFEGEHAIGASFVKDDDSNCYRDEEQLHNQHVLTNALPDNAWVDSLEFSHSGRVSIRCATQDRLPLMGMVLDPLAMQQPLQGNMSNNLFILSGLGSRGICTAPLLAETLVCQILGKPLPLSTTQLAAVNPNRFYWRKHK